VIVMRRSISISIIGSFLQVTNSACLSWALQVRRLG
jgi:hypothetical protein